MNFFYNVRQITHNKRTPPRQSPTVGKRLMRAGSPTPPLRVRQSPTEGFPPAALDIGQALAKRLTGFDMRLIYNDVQPLPAEKEKTLSLSYVSFETLLQESDFVVLMLPLMTETFHLINREKLARIKRGSFIINSCRGSVVDEQAVADALDSGHLAGYAADVFEMEDWARVDRPTFIPESLLSAKEKTFFTPHLGSAIHDVRRDIALEAAHNIIQALHGETPPGAVNQL